MIDYLRVQNFQSHHKTELQFDPGVNVIIGTSDAGKTALIRALKWVVFNRAPHKRKVKGDSFRSNWGGKTVVRIGVDNKTIKHIKDHHTSYTYNGITFKSTGMSVPKEIVDALNFNEINLQQQFDQPFLLNSSPGDVALHFNRIAHLDSIDHGLKQIQTQIRSTENQLVFDRQNLKETLLNFKKFKNLDELDGMLNAVEQQERSRISLISSIKQIVKHVDAVNAIDNECTQYEQLIRVKNEVYQALDLYAKLKNTRDQTEELQGIIDQLDEIKSNIVMKEALLENLRKKFNKIFPDICPLCGQKRKDCHEK